MSGAKNILIGLVAGGALVAGGMALLDNDSGTSSTGTTDQYDSGAFIRTDSPLETRTQLSTGGPDKDCADFGSQRQAQAFFEANGGPSQDPHNLDRDGDGEVCETLP